MQKLHKAFDSARKRLEAKQRIVLSGSRQVIHIIGFFLLGIAMLEKM